MISDRNFKSYVYLIIGYTTGDIQAAGTIRAYLRNPGTSPGMQRERRNGIAPEAEYRSQVLGRTKL